MKIKVVDGFVWLVVTDKAKQIWYSKLFNMYILFSNGEASVNDFGIDNAIEIARLDDVEIVIEGGYINM